MAEDSIYFIQGNESGMKARIRIKGKNDYLISFSHVLDKSNEIKDTKE